jgi:hypothetical protein
MEKSKPSDKDSRLQSACASTTLIWKITPFLRCKSGKKYTCMKFAINVKTSYEALWWKDGNLLVVHRGMPLKQIPINIATRRLGPCFQKLLKSIWESLRHEALRTAVLRHSRLGENCKNNKRSYWWRMMRKREQERGSSEDGDSWRNINEIKRKYGKEDEIGRGEGNIIM